MSENRITLNDSGQSVVLKLAEGNPGAMRVCCEVLRDGSDIDPANALQGFGPLLMLDDLGIYGPDIWLLYKDVCNQNLVAMLGVLRAYQMGYATEAQIRCAIGNRGDVLDVAALLDKVREELPTFAAEGEV